MDETFHEESSSKVSITYGDLSLLNSYVFIMQGGRKKWLYEGLLQYQIVVQRRKSPKITPVKIGSKKKFYEATPQPIGVQEEYSCLNHDKIGLIIYHEELTHMAMLKLRQQLPTKLTIDH